MHGLDLHEFHAGLNAVFTSVNDREVVGHYGDVLAEHAAFRDSAGVIDLSCRGRVCLTGADSVRFLHGQVTNNVKDLDPGGGCYAALVTAKGKMESDLNIYCLPNELLLDIEPGCTARIMQRLEKYIIADDVQLVDVASQYGLLSVQGPKAPNAISSLGLELELPVRLMSFSTVRDTTLGEIYCVNLPRGQTLGFDLFVPTPALAAVADKLIGAAKSTGGRACGWQALEIVRIEAGIPRFGQDMDESNLPPETGIEARAVSYTKGCYIGQEVIARIRTYGQVAKSLRGLQLADDLTELPQKGDKLFHGDKEAGYITSALASPTLQANIALGYVRREHQPDGATLTLHSGGRTSAAKLVSLPFVGSLHNG